MPLSFFLIRTLIRKRDTVIGKFHCLHYSRSSFEGAERQQPATIPPAAAQTPLSG